MAKKHLNPLLQKPKLLSYYGTAGYRGPAEDMVNVVCRASVIAYIRSATFAGKYIGLYVTASHNPAEHNGVKFVDFNGSMVEESWEQSSDYLVNCEDADFYSTINKIFRQQSNCANMQDSIYGNVIIGRDTRASGEKLVAGIKEVLKEMRCNVYDYGVVACPEMHFLVRLSNIKREMVDKREYIDHLYKTFGQLKEITGNNVIMGVDTSNGVAQLKVDELLARDADLGMEVLNDLANGILNFECGTDYIISKKMMPKIKKSQFRISASFDGDMDRLVFYDGLRYFDGDAQCVFLAHYLKKITEEVGIRCEVGAVLSFYSNTGAVEYLKSKVRVVFAPTGIKNFVKEAKAFDIGVYFEPNGHGSIMFSRSVVEAVESLKENSTLKQLVDMFNPLSCDALANMLVFKALLREPDELMPYKEHHSRHLQVVVKDKTRVRVDKNYRLLDLQTQKEIDQAVTAFKGRAFVRPSGTEDVVRIFAESQHELQCDKLALTVAQLIYDRYGGTGRHPEISYHE